MEVTRVSTSFDDTIRSVPVHSVLLSVRRSILQILFPSRIPDSKLLDRQGQDDFDSKIASSHLCKLLSPPEKAAKDLLQGTGGLPRRRASAPAKASRGLFVIMDRDAVHDWHPTQENVPLRNQGWW